jgi:nitroreductase
VSIAPEALLELLRSRRVCRSFTPEPVDEATLRMIVEAGRWASSASNNRVHRFLVVRDPATIRLVRAVSPGMLGRPPALIAICTDLAARSAAGLGPQDTSTWIDVGTAAMNMMVLAHSLGLGTCPTTSFSHSAVGAILELTGRALPECLLQVGHPAPLRGRTRPRADLERFVYWDRYGSPGSD